MSEALQLFPHLFHFLLAPAPTPIPVFSLLMNPSPAFISGLSCSSVDIVLTAICIPWMPVFADDLLTSFLHVQVLSVISPVFKPTGACVVSSPLSVTAQAAPLFFKPLNTQGPKELTMTKFSLGPSKNAADGSHPGLISFRLSHWVSQTSRIQIYPPGNKKCEQKKLKLLWILIIMTRVDGQ